MMTDHSALLELFEDVSDGVCLVDPAGTVLGLNAACARMFGCDSAQAVGHPLIVFADLSGARVRDLDGTTRIAVFPRRPDNAELESFAYIVSHDLKEPLRAMSVFAEALGDDYGKDLDDTGREYVGYITEGAIRMSRMVDDLLEFTRVGRGGLKTENVSLDEVVRDALEDLSERADAANAQVKVASELGEASLDRRVFGQALGHVFRNALAFAGEGAQPDISVSADRNGGMIRLSVADKGIGIRPDRHELVFGVFERFGPRNANAGSGIGLAVARKALRMHGGDVTLSSEPGEGSVFRLELPAGD